MAKVRVSGGRRVAVFDHSASPRCEAARKPKRSRLSALGSVLAVGMFGTTLSFLISTPAARTRTTKGVPILADVGQFLVKDVVLLGAALLTLGEALRRRSRRW